MAKIISEGNPKQSFKEFLRETADKDKALREWCLLLEHEVYKLIPGSRNSVRADRGNTNTMTLPHSHVYAMPKGRGKEHYAVNYRR